MSKKSDIKGFEKILDTSPSSVKFSNYINSIAQPNSEGLVIPYDHGATVNASSYIGGVYHPILNRLYFVPYGQSSSTTWHYLNCDTAAIVGYSVTALSASAYSGGIWNETLKRIYLIPYAQSNQTNWHYIDSAGTLTSYAHGLGADTPVVNGYIGGAIHTSLNRLYPAPNSQATEAKHHYLDLTTGTWTAFTHSLTITGNYIGACYFPELQRVYYSPNTQSNVANWHYISSAGTLTSYTHGQGTSILTNGFSGITYSPIQKRLYLTPLAQATETNWFYIDEGGVLVSYTHTGISALTNAYQSSVFSPTQNRIYFIPYAQATPTNQWHYIDCSSTASNDFVVAYTHGATTVVDQYYSGIYVPTMNRIYFVPYGTSSSWHYIKPLTTNNANITLMSGAMFNKL